MTALYVDTSCLARVLFSRPGRRVPLGGRSVAITSELTRVELSRAIERARLIGSVDDAEAGLLRRSLTDALSRMIVFELASEVVEVAATPFGVAISSLAALHAATAQLVRAEAPDLVFWTHDADRATAALSRGLPVDGN